MQTNQAYYRFLTLALAGLITSTLLMFLLTEFHEEITEPWLGEVDRHAMSVVHSNATPMLTDAMFALSMVGSWKFVTPTVVLLFLFLLFRRAIADATVLAVAVGGSALLNIGLKLWFQRARPDVPWALASEHSFSFPSGHAVGAFSFYGTTIYLLLRSSRSPGRVAVASIMMALIVGIGLSRVYLGVHYPSDIVAGYLVGFVFVSAVVLASRRLSKRRPSRSPT